MSDLRSFEEADLDRIADDLMRAYRVCRQAVAGVMRGDGKADASTSVRALSDCADVTLTLANLLLRESVHTLGVAEIAMDVAKACAEQIRSEEHDVPRLRVAYAVCLRVQQDCLELLGKEVPVIADELDETIEESFPASDPVPPPTEI